MNRELIILDIAMQVNSKLYNTNIISTYLYNICKNKLSKKASDISYESL